MAGSESKPLAFAQSNRGLFVQGTRSTCIGDKTSPGHGSFIIGAPSGPDPRALDRTRWPLRAMSLSKAAFSFSRFCGSGAGKPSGFGSSTGRGGEVLKASCSGESVCLVPDLGSVSRPSSRAQVEVQRDTYT